MLALGAGVAATVAVVGGDEAARCGLLWVRKGNVYFSVGPRNASETWPATAERLARRVLTRLP